MKKFYKSILENKDYIIGIVCSVALPLVIMLLYWNKSISNYDGWYNLYAQDILNGRVPYLDFHFLMPPFYLYAWTVLQKIFGNYIIVFHAASVVLKCCIAALIFHTLQRFYNKKISFVATAISSVVMLSAPFDNCTLSYNEVVTFLGFIILNCVLTFSNILIDEKKVSYKRIVGIAVLCAILFATKQTHGVIVPLATVIISGLIIYKEKDIMTVLKSAAWFLASFFITLYLIFTPLMRDDDWLSHYIQNVYMGVTAKGSPLEILKVPVKLFADTNYLIIIFFVATIIFITYMLKKYCNIKMQNMNAEFKSKLLPANIVTFGLYMICVIIAVFYNWTHFDKTLYTNDTLLYHINQVGFLCEIAAFYMALFYFLRYMLLNDEKDAKKLILFGLGISIGLATILSHAMPYFIFYIFALVFAAMLNYKFHGSIFVEVGVYLLSILIIIPVTLWKISLPFAFHGYLSTNIAVERKVSRLDSLKGFSLSKNEVEMYEYIYDTLNKYLDKNDKIFAFINNQAFYNLMGRQPYYPDIYSLYWDVCPDDQAKIIYDGLLKEDIKALPPAIIYFQNSESNINLHESMFRGGNKRNYQRAIDLLIKKYMVDNKYKDVLEYNSDYVTYQDPDMRKDLQDVDKYTKQIYALYRTMVYDDMVNINNWDEILKVEDELKRVHDGFMTKFTEGDRFIFEYGYRLRVLIRSDIYQKINSAQGE